ncbi:MAG: hypothetical protein U0V48_02985 [Anaerolineales bacterium]
MTAHHRQRTPAARSNRQTRFRRPQSPHRNRQRRDARNALNAIELAVRSTEADNNGVVHITLDVAQESIQRRAVLYDKDGDAHYDTISAFIKSVLEATPTPRCTGSPK